jgi:carbamoyltransferase
MKPRYVLGVSCYYHDSAAALLRDGVIVGAVQEERFSRKRHDADFPRHSVSYLLREAGVTLDDLEAVVYYEKPFVTFERLIETHLAHAPFGFRPFLQSMPVWLRQKLFLERDIRRELRELSPGAIPPIKYSEHHLSHAASAFYPSPFEKAAVLCVDGVGEWATTSAWVGTGASLKPLWEIHFPHSLGLLYSTLTAYLGFKVNSGEYKVMGLAPYGEPRFADLLQRELVTLHDDGGFSLNMRYFAFGHKLRMFDARLEALLGRPARVPEGELDAFHMDVAASLQVLLERVLLHVVRRLREQTHEEDLCLAGGVALNCVANSRLLREAGFRRIWVQPSAGDAGGALGAAQAYWHLGLAQGRDVGPRDGQQGSYLGPAFTDDEIARYLREAGVPFRTYSRLELLQKTCEHLEQKAVIGWFQGRMEFGPRALGHRSIIGDARVLDLQRTMNLKIKFRESFRPFAPIVLEEEAPEIFDHPVPSPYMLFVAPVRDEHRLPLAAGDAQKFGIDKLNVARSRFPAITHVDYSARLQTVGAEQSELLHELLSTFRQRTGSSVLVNTSFNVRGEPIVCTPQDALRCFRRTGIDVLVLGSHVITKAELPATSDTSWESEYELD